jgi:hypothetical protein
MYVTINWTGFVDWQTVEISHNDKIAQRTAKTKLFKGQQKDFFKELDCLTKKKSSAPLPTPSHMPGGIDSSTKREPGSAC